MRCRILQAQSEDYCKQLDDYRQGLQAHAQADIQAAMVCGLPLQPPIHALPGPSAHSSDASHAQSCKPTRKSRCS